MFNDGDYCQVHNDLVRQENNQNNCVSPKTQDLRTPPPNFNLIYEMVDELEQWKACQEEKFLQQLKIKEAQHLRKLTQAYSEFKVTKDQELNDKMDQFSSLFSSVEQIYADLKQNVPDHTKCNDLLIRIRRDMINQLSGVKEKVLVLQQQSLDRLQSHTLKEQELRGHIAMHARENAKLKQQIALMEQDQLEFNARLKALEEFPKENKRLRTLYDDLALKKTYYKEQWIRVIRELHKLKTSHSDMQATLHENSEQPYPELQQYINHEFEELCLEAREPKSIKRFVT